MWEVEYDNDVGDDDGGFWEWWNVTNGDKYFRCEYQDDAKWLCDTLNSIAPNVCR